MRHQVRFDSRKCGFAYCTSEADLRKPACGWRGIPKGSFDIRRTNILRTKRIIRLKIWDEKNLPRWQVYTCSCPDQGSLISRAAAKYNECHITRIYRLLHQENFWIMKRFIWKGKNKENAKEAHHSKQKYLSRIPWFIKYTSVSPGILSNYWIR